MGDIDDISFLDTNNGWILAREPQIPDRQIFVNIKNKGNDLQIFESDPSIRYYSVQFVAENIGFCFGLHLATNDRKVYKLIQQTEGLKIEDPGIFINSAQWSKISFINENEGWIAGGGVIYHTNDGGKSWYKQHEYERLSEIDFQFIDSKHGWITNSYSIIRTSDGGLTWEDIVMPNSSNVSKLHFVDKDYGWCIGDGVVMKTTNGGRSWEKNEWLRMSSLTDVMFVNRNTGYILEARYIYKTTDGGNTWIVTNRLNEGYLHKILFTEECFGMALGNNGIILIYSDNTTEENNNGDDNHEHETIPYNFELHQNYPNPFNNYTTLKFSLPEEGIPVFKIYNVLGELVTTIRPRTYGKGLNKMKWDGKDKYGRQVVNKQ